MNCISIKMFMNCFYTVLFCSLLLHSQESITHNDQTIAMIGTGYVGLVTGACLADIGNKVLCADVVKEKIEGLQHGVMPIYEPGLDELVLKNVEQKRLAFTYDVQNAIRQADVLFIAVGTPMAEDGQADLSAIINVAHMISENMSSYKVIVIKSTVPIGTCAKVRAILQDYGVVPDQFDMVSNPEFLREGAAVSDFLQPDRIVIGVESEYARVIMQDIYQPMIDRHIPFVCTNLQTSETIKYASNALLAAKISFINEIANLCDATGASVYTVGKAMGLDRRIGPLFLNPGPGFGGSCFPKDCQALMYQAHAYGVDMKIVEATLQANENQKSIAFKKLSKLLQTVDGKTIAVLGLAFKANTDDIRYSPSIKIIQQLLENGALVNAYDPAASENMKKIFPHITYAATPYEALLGADACVVMTEWPEFKVLDLEKIAVTMKQKIVVDMRGLLDKEKLYSLGFAIDTIGI